MTPGSPSNDSPRKEAVVLGVICLIALAIPVASLLFSARASAGIGMASAILLGLGGLVMVSNLTLWHAKRRNARAKRHEGTADADDERRPSHLPMIAGVLGLLATLLNWGHPVAAAAACVYMVVDPGGPVAALRWALRDLRHGGRNR